RSCATADAAQREAATIAPCASRTKMQRLGVLIFPLIALSACAQATTKVATPASAGIQYAAAYPLKNDGLWNTGSPAGACHRAALRADPVAGDDSGGPGRVRRR